MPLPLKEIAFVAQKKVSIFYNILFCTDFGCLILLKQQFTKAATCIFVITTTMSMQRRLAVHEFHYDST